MSGEVSLGVKVTAGRQLCVSKEGSTLVARAQWASHQLDSAIVSATTSPEDYDLHVQGEMAGSGPTFCDQIVRYPLLVMVNEIFAKDKKQKEEKVVTHASFTLDLAGFLSGENTLTEKFTAASSELSGMVVEMEVEVTIEKPFPATFLERDYRILTLRLFNASNIPEAWVGANFTASVPIPRANGEAQGVQLSGKAEQVHTEEKTLPLNWTTSDGQQHATGRSAPFSPEPQHARQGSMVVWNAERRLLLSVADCDAFQTRLDTFASYIPIEVARAREPEGAKKGKGKQEDNELQNHGVAMVDLAPLLYPGVKSVNGAFNLQPYTDAAMMTSGFSASIAEEMHRTGSTLAVDHRLKSGMARASNASDLSSEKKTPTASADSTAYQEHATTVFVEFSLSRPFVERRRLGSLTANVADLIPKREPIPRKRFGAEASVEEYHNAIADIGRKVLQDIRHFRQTPANEESFHDSLMYKINKAGKYSEYHEQLKYAVIRIVREKYLKTGQFTSDEEFKTFLETLYVFLVKEMHKSLNKTVVQDAPAEPEKVASLAELATAASFAEQMGQPAKAQRLWTELLARDDSSPACWRGLARTALLQGDTDRAHEALEEACSLDSADPWTMILAASVSRSRGDLYRTKVLLSRASANPNQEDQTKPESEPVAWPLERAIAFTMLAGIYGEELNHQMNQFAKLEAERIGKHYQLDVAGRGIYLRAGELFLESQLKGNAQEMLALYMASLGTGESLPGRALLLKSRLEANENLETALDTILQATKSDHANPSVWAQLGHLLLKMGDKEKAKESLVRAVTYQQSPDRPEAVFICLADLLLEEADFAEARRHYLMAAEVCPTATAWTGVGICSLRLGQLEEAEDALAEANLLDPLNPQVWGYLSLLCLQTQRKLEAEQSFKFASKLNLSDESLLGEIRQWQQKVGFGDPSY